MSQCTCSKDREMTCIVHPTDRSLRGRIAELEAKLEAMDPGNAYIENGVLHEENAIYRAKLERYEGLIADLDSYLKLKPIHVPYGPMVRIRRLVEELGGIQQK